MGVRRRPWRWVAGDDGCWLAAAAVGDRQLVAGVYPGEGERFGVVVCLFDGLGRPVGSVSRAGAGSTAEGARAAAEAVLDGFVWLWGIGMGSRNVRPTFIASAEWLAAERAAAIRWARRLMDRRDWIVLDTETTGLGVDAEVVEISVVDHAGVVLIDELVRPVDPIPAAATAVHGIGDGDVAGARSYDQVHRDLVEVVRDRLVVIYNAAFDRRILAQSAARYGLPAPVPYQYDQDAMELYAQFVGEWSAAHGDFRWQRLPPAPGVSAHRALGDCLSTLALIRRMAEAG